MWLNRLSPKRRLTVRHFAVVLVALGHAGLAVLAYVNLLQFTLPSEYAFVEMAADNDVWFWIHAVVAVFLLLSLRYDRLSRQALSASAGFMFGWAFFNMVWGLSTVEDRGVSLAGPLLGFILAGGSYLMAIAPLPTDVRCHHDRN